MCDKYSHEYGYICDECFDELVKTGPTTDISKFMKTPRKQENKFEQARARYEQVFKT